MFNLSTWVLHAKQSLLTFHVTGEHRVEFSSSCYSRWRWGSLLLLCTPFSSQLYLLLFLFFRHFGLFLKYPSIYQDDAVFKYMYFYFINFCCTHSGMSTFEVSTTRPKSFLQCLRDVWFYFLTGQLLNLCCSFIRDALRGTKADREQAGADSFTPVTAD